MRDNYENKSLDIEKMDMETPNITSENIEKIGGLFPNCITERRDEEGNLKKAINFDLLKQVLSEDVVDGEEAYEFTWVGKKASLLEANKPIRKTLRPCIEESKDWDNTENLYIEGDNLDALKLLQESYLNKIKMIYIDPPYNTGNDFIYNDDFKMTYLEYSNEINQYDEHQKRLFKNTNSNGRFHSDWCSMLYSRLLLARNLLSDDGVIFISIDDNEQENLKKICGEIFGEPNFIGYYIKQSKVGGGSDSRFIVKEHEYCIVYAKDAYYTDEMFIEHDKDYLKRYKEEDNKGKYFWDTFARPGLKNPIIYEIEAPDGKRIKNGWIRSKERFKRDYAAGEIRIVKNYQDEWSVQFKQYLNRQGKKPRSISMDFGGTIEGKNELKQMFHGNVIFSYPKSVKYIKTLINTLSTDDLIILDFFSGSSTTAHAVMQLNAEDGGNRKFIMVQLPEETGEDSEAFKAGYKNICEIGKERIRRAGEKIKEDFKDTEGIENLDIGFRVLKIDDSNMKDVYYTPDELDPLKLKDLESNIKGDRTELDLLFGCLVDWGLPLSYPYKSEEINGVTVHDYNSGDLMACFSENISDDVIKEIAKRKPIRVVFRDSSFRTSADKINVQEIFKLLSPDTSIKVL